MRIPTYAVLVFSALLLIGMVNGANVTIGPIQGHVAYRVNLNNQGKTIASFILNESAQPTSQNGIVLVTATVSSASRNFTYSRALNTSSFPEVFPYLLGINNQSLSYHAYGVSLTIGVFNAGSTPIMFNGRAFQGTSYRVNGAVSYPWLTAAVSANGTIIAMPSGLIYSLELGSTNSYSVQMLLEQTNLALDAPSNTSLPVGIAFVGLGLFGAAVFAVPSIFKKLKPKREATAGKPEKPGNEEKPSYWVD